MHKAQREMKEKLNQIDLIIEVLDARIPFSSSNPSIDKLVRDKPRIKLLNKGDLACPQVSSMWLSQWSSDTSKAILIEQHNEALIRQLRSHCEQLCPISANKPKTLHAMIMGIPNVGKSTLINLLAGKKIAKTGNEPAITKGQQRINLGDGLLLIDTPGILWPRVDNPASSYRLGVTGAIRETALEYEDIATFLLDFMLRNHPETLEQRFKISTTDEPIKALEQAAINRGCIQGGKRIDYDRISRLIITEFRSGLLGRISLEKPSDIETEMRQVAQLQAEKAAKEIEKKGKKKKPTP